MWLNYCFYNTAGSIVEKQITSNKFLDTVLYITLHNSNISVDKLLPIIFNFIFNLRFSSILLSYG